MQVAEDKKILRSKYKCLRKGLAADEKAKLCNKISKAFLESYLYKDSEHIYIYVSSEIEVDTHFIIESCFDDNKHVYVPRCIDGTNNMDFYEINSFDNLETGAYGILEPKKDLCEPVGIISSGICIVPALSYDLCGFRLGFGKGYYDRFLSRFTGKKIGLCYESCICDSLPHDEFDVNVDILISDEKIYVFE